MDQHADPRLNIIRSTWSTMRLTQKEAAAQLGISQPAFNQYLKGKIPLNTEIVLKFATLFNVPPSKIDSRLY